MSLQTVGRCMPLCLRSLTCSAVGSMTPMSLTSPLVPARYLHVTPPLGRIRSGRYRSTRNRSRALTYEQFTRPEYLFVRKGFNSFNTSNLKDGLRPAETAVEDMFIRKFVLGTWHGLFLSEVIIKRQLNMIRLAGLVHRAISPRKMYFLVGYTEELLSCWLQCVVKLELQTVADKSEVIFKYV